MPRTLEELQDADLLLHVIDAADAGLPAHIRAVDDILAQLGLDRKPLIPVFNKMDIAEPDTLARCMQRYGGVAISALSTQTLAPLIRMMEDQVQALVSEGAFRPLAEPCSFPA